MSLFHSHFCFCADASSLLFTRLLAAVEPVFILSKDTLGLYLCVYSFTVCGEASGTGACAS